MFALASAAVWAGVGILADRAETLDGLRLFWLDQLFVARQRLGRSPRPHPDVVIVGIDERTRDAMRKRIGKDVEDRWVFRDVIGRLLVALAKAKVKAVGVDYLLDRPLGDQVDKQLVGALEGGPQVGTDGIDAVLGCFVTLAEEKRPTPALQGLADEGNLIIQADADGKYRRLRPGLVMLRPDLSSGQEAPADQPGANVRIPLFAFQACKLFVGRTDNEYGSARLTAWTWHDRDDGSVEVPGAFRVPAEMLVDFCGPAQSFDMAGQQFSALDVLEGRVGADKLQGKLVLIGPTLRSADRFAVPVSPAAAGERYRRFLDRKYGLELDRLGDEGIRVDLLSSGAMSGIEIHANVAGQILQGRYLHEAAREARWLGPVLILAIVPGLGWVFWQEPRSGKRRVLRGMLAGSVLLVAVLGGAAAGSLWAFVGWRWVYVPLGLMAAWTGQAACGITFTGVRLRRQSQKIEQMFGSAVGHELLEYIHAHPEILTRNQRRVATVLFCDIRGFTPLTERLDSDEVVDLLRRHFEAFWGALDREGSWVDKYVGDLVMAAWNVLQPMEDHALRGVRAAVGMKIARDALNQQRFRRGEPPVEIGIGLHTGELVGGNIGSRKRSNFTLIGDMVNLASRIEHEARGGEVLISEDAYALVKDHVIAEARPPVAIRGKTGLYRLYEVLGMVGGPIIPGKEERAHRVSENQQG